jgi:hypothetical protein
MRVMMNVTRPRIHRNHTPRPRNCATHVLELHCRVVHMKPVSQNTIDPA